MKKLLVILFVFTFNLSPDAQELPEQFLEPFSDSYAIRKEQHMELKAYVDNVLNEKIETSLNKFQPDFFSIESYENSLYPYRKQLSDYFGYPPPKAAKGKITRFEKAGEDKYSTVYRVWIEVIDNVHAYGLYLLPKTGSTEIPLIVAIHGGGGNPEAICGLDTRVNYHNFGYEAVKRGYAVWAPGLTMLSGYAKDPEIPGISRGILDNQLKKAGTSIIGLEIHKIIESTRAMVKERQEIDEKNIGMTGLSWGGFFTMYTAALAPFVKAAAPSAYFRDSKKDLENMLDADSNSSIYSYKGFGHFQVIGMICPRPCLVQLGNNDTLFDLEGAKTEAKRAASFYNKLDIPERFIFDVHAGGHEYENERIFRFFDNYLKQNKNL
jgi:dienelactone hydrolase